HPCHVVNHLGFVLPKWFFYNQELRIHYCNTGPAAPHRRLEWQICVATALAAHTDPCEPLAIELLRTCAALPAPRSQISPGLPAVHPVVRPMSGSGIDGGHIAHGADRSALRRFGALGLGSPRWRRARQSPAAAFPSPLTLADRNKPKGSTHGEGRFASSGRDLA